ncbi:MAG: hypothetical protein U1E45_08015 [Geminicoccaceae bacterium]|mgnify:CR=1 FL=1
MSTLAAAQDRVEKALARIERAVQERSSAAAEGGGDHAVECARLRRLLAESEAERARLDDALDEVGLRLDQAIDRVAELAGD